MAVPNWQVKALCFSTMAVEGYGLQLAGVAAIGIRKDLDLSPTQMGLFFSIASVGLAIGAAAGGALANRLSRRSILIGSLALFGIASIATVTSNGFSILLLFRLFGGLALGAVLSNIIALASDSSPPGRQYSGVTIAYAGTPLGGAIVASLAVWFGPGGWQTLFILNGVSGLVVALFFFGLSEGKGLSRSCEGNATFDRSEAGLFSGWDQTKRTLALWMVVGGTALILYLILNWLPLVLADSGLSVKSATAAQIAFTSVGILSGLTVGRALERFEQRIVFSVLFICLFILFLTLSLGPPRTWLLFLEVGGLGLTVNALQGACYSLAPPLYPQKTRAVGVGAAVASGRVGSIIGPLMGAGLVSLHLGPQGVFLGLLPAAAVTGICAIYLVTKHAVPKRALR